MLTDPEIVQTAHHKKGGKIPGQQAETRGSQSLERSTDKQCLLPVLRLRKIHSLYQIYTGAEVR